MSPQVDALPAAPFGQAVLALLMGVDLAGRVEPSATACLVADRDDPDPARARPAPRSPASVPPGTPSALAAQLDAAVADADLDQLARCQDAELLLSAVARASLPQPGLDEPYRLAAAYALAPAATALLRAPAARWWWEPLGRSAQRWIGPAGAAPLRGAALAESLRRRTADDAARERDLRRSGSRSHRRRWLSRPVPAGVDWWSAPLGGTMFTSTGPVGGLPAAELGVTRDGAGEETVAVWAVEAAADARIREVASLADWCRLTADYPLDVTASRGPDWHEWTGLAGPWILPDWPAVARDWDGVHVSVGGYLEASGPPAPVPGGWTLLAGWEPDWTLWLGDVFSRVVPAGSWHGAPGSDALTQGAFPWLRHPGRLG